MQQPFPPPCHPYIWSTTELRRLQSSLACIVLQLFVVFPRVTASTWLWLEFVSSTILALAAAQRSILRWHVGILPLFLDKRCFAVRFTVFRYSIYGNAAAVIAGSLRSTKPRFRSVQPLCAHRNSGIGLCSGTVLIETKVLVCAAALRLPKPRFRSVQLLYAH